MLVVFPVAGMAIEQPRLLTKVSRLGNLSPYPLVSAPAVGTTLKVPVKLTIMLLSARHLIRLIVFPRLPSLVVTF